MDGNFSLMVTPNARLSISYIGYATQEVVVKDQRPLNVTLKEDTRLIDEVVVVGYGVQKKANLTGAVSSVKMDDVLGDRPVVSVSDALKGAMPGLQITGNSGRPGEEMSFNIRGVNSLDKNGKPLVLVDNVEMDINMLDPNDIESVTVLKDAASSAIYGARAAFGVILITTKKGSDATKLSINYSNNFSFSRPANMPHKATPLQTVQAYKDMGTINYQSGQNVDTWLGLLKEYNANPSAYPDGYAMVDGLRYSLAETDLFDDMMETGFQQTHNISVGGGTKDISYRFSFGMVNENGVLASDKDTYKRYNVSSYLRSDVFSWITPELDIKYTNSNSSLPETSGGYGIWGAAVAFPSYFPTGTMNIDGEELPINTPRNLIDLAYPTTIQKNNLRIFGKVTISPLKNVKLIGEYTFNHLSNEKTKFEKKFYYAHGGNFVKEVSTANSKYEYSNGITDYNALNFYANYNNSWGKHDVTVMGGFKIYIMIADAQALTDNADNPEKVRQNILEVALDYLSCGLDPEKSTIFIQSQIPELCELSFYYMNLVTVSRLQRNPTVKSEIQMRNFEASIPVGFFTYPISQAADITAFKATTVPVGEDQMPMIEQTQEIVHKFNTVYGEALVQPKIMLPENDSCRRLPGIDGKAKMSKSLGNCIYLSEEPDEIKKKVMSMYTDPDHIKITDPGKIEGNTVFTYLDAFCQPEHFERYLPDYANLDELKAHYQRGGLGDVKVKKFLNNVLQETLEPIRNRRKELEKDIPAIYEMLKKGSEEAEKVAAQTLADVKAAMKINYFDDLDLIRSQAERYGK